MAVPERSAGREHGIPGAEEYSSMIDMFEWVDFCPLTKPAQAFGDVTCTGPKYDAALDCQDGAGGGRRGF